MPTRSSPRRLLAGLLVALVVTACGGGGGSGGSSGEAGGAGGTDGAVKTGGKILARSDFVLEANSLPFENYGNEPGVTNLIADDMRAVYGDVVCASLADGTCVLTPPAQLEMEFWNQAMAGGHCFGFSVASLQFSKSQLAPDPFGAGAVPELVLEGNTALQRKLAQGFMAQGYIPVREQALTGPPSAVIDFLVDHFDDKGNSETYTLGFFKPDGTGGHAVTPYAVVDRGKGKVGLQIYDNNFPGEAREMAFDVAEDSWSYYASPIPDEPESRYFGDAALDTLELYPTSPGMGTQPCWFCADPNVPAGDEPFLGAGKALGKLFVTGSPDDQPSVLLTDAKGRRTGYVDGKLRTDIPGVKVEHYYFANRGGVKSQPVYRVPLDAKVKVAVTGSGEVTPDAAKVGFAGPGFAVAVGNLEVDPGQTDEITLPSGGETFAYEAGDEESPTFQIGADFAGADIALAVSPESMKKGATVELGLSAGSLEIDTAGKVGELDVVIDRVDEDGKETFDAGGLTLDAAATGALDFGDFASSGDTVTYEVEEDGEVTTETVADEDTPGAQASASETGDPDSEGEEPETTSTSGSSTSTTSGGPTRSSTTSTTGDAPATGAEDDTTTTSTPAGDGPSTTTTTIEADPEPGADTDAGTTTTTRRPAAEPSTTAGSTTTTTTSPDG